MIIFLVKKVLMFTPLLPAGFHDFSEEMLENHFLSGFPGSATREKLIQGLQKYIKDLKSLKLPFELWIDGSFVTNKMNPNDIDLVVLIPEQVCNKLSLPEKKNLQLLLNNWLIRNSYFCDVYFCVLEDQDLRNYWQDWFGFTRKKEPKGIVRIKVS